EAAFCAMRLGRPETARRILEGIDGAATVRIAGRMAPIARWLRELPAVESDLVDDRRVVPAESRSDSARFAQHSVIVASLSSGDFNDSGVNVSGDRQASRSGSPPALGHPLWSATLAGDQSRHIEALAQAWEAFQLQNGLSVGTSQMPLLADQRL